MAESRSSSGRGRSGPGSEREGRLAGSVFWVAAVAAILALAWLLRADGPVAERPGPAAPSSSAPVSLPETPAAEPPAELEAPAPAVRPAPVPPPAPSGPSARMAERALRDARRVASGGGDWTAQVAVLCDAAGAESLAARVRDDGNLFVLPAEVGERSCFRVCWGRFADAESARSARVPASLTGGSKPTPRRISEVLP